MKGFKFISIALLCCLIFCGGGAAHASDEHSVLFINLAWYYLDDGNNMYKTLQDVVGESNTTIVRLTSNGQIKTLLENNHYDQIWLFDISNKSDTYDDDWEAIANWFNKDNSRAILCDGRIISSYKSNRDQTEGKKLTENYYENMKRDGGGLLLGTDHNTFANGGTNDICRLIGIGDFTGNFNLAKIPVDTKSPLMTYPNNMGDSLYNDSSTSQAPYGLQPNGRILYSVAWHSGNKNTPGISYTGKGSVGFFVKIDSPANNSRFASGETINFSATYTSTVSNAEPFSFTWTSNIDGVLSTNVEEELTKEQKVSTSSLSAGKHLITLQGSDSQNGADADSITVVVGLPVATIENISPTGSVAGNLIEFEGHGGGSEDYTITGYRWAINEMVDGEKQDEAIPIGSTASFFTDKIPAGTWMVSFWVKNSENHWSLPANQEIKVEDSIDFSDLAVGRNDIRFLDKDGKDVWNPQKGDTIFIEAKIHNISMVDTTDKVDLSIYNGDTKSGTVIGNATIDEIKSGSSVTQKIEWKISDNIDDGYKVISIHVEYQNPDDNKEVSTENNFATAAIVVGTVGSGSYAMDVTANAPAILYSGYDSTIFGDAKYSWGSRLPVMGAIVTVEIEETGERYTSRTRAPNGKYTVDIELPPTGIYNAKVCVFDNNLYSCKTIKLKVVDPPIYIWDIDLGKWVPEIDSPDFDSEPAIPPPSTDLEIESINFTGDKVYTIESGGTRSIVNNEVKVNVEIINDGNLAVKRDFSVKLYDANPASETAKLLKTIDVDADDMSDKKESLTFDGWTPNEAKAYDIYVVVDADNTVQEANENNNLICRRIEVREARPDLKPSGLNISVTAPVRTESVIISADIYNKGQAGSGNSFKVSYYINNLYNPTDSHQTIGIDTVDVAIAKGESHKSSITWDTSNYSAGNHVIYAIVDEEEAVAEDIENNNTTSKNLYLYDDKADLYPVDLTSSPASPYPSTEITLTATIRNLGGLNSESEEVIFYLNDNQIGSAQSGIIAAKGASKAVSINWTTPANNGTIYIIVEVNGHQYIKNINISSTPPPDLKILSEDIDYSPSSPVSQNEEVTIWADIENISNQTDAENFVVRFLTDSPVSGLVEVGTPQSIESLTKSSQMKVTANETLKATEQFYAVLVQLIPTTKQGDANPGNNEATTSLFVDIGLPFAVAGDDLIAKVKDTVKLDGSKSLNVTEYIWELIAKPEGSAATLSNADTANPEFVPDKSGNYVVQLKVTDGTGYSEPDEVQITVDSNSFNINLKAG
ncbi:exported hypothetical protein [Candidatus Magnetomoraceae bacterium gMMP-15]